MHYSTVMVLPILQDLVTNPPNEIQLKIFNLAEEGIRIRAFIV